MGTRVRFIAGAVAGLMAFAAGSALAQTPLTVRAPSQRATVSQTIGLTEIALTYHRPAVKGRKVRGDLLPLGKV